MWWPPETSSSTTCQRGDKAEEPEEGGDETLDIKHVIYDYLLASNIIFKLVKRRVYSCAVWRPPGSPGGGGGAGFGWGEGGDQAGGGAQAAQGPLKAVGHLDQFHDPVLHH